MEFTVKELSEIVAGVLEGPGGLRITRAAGLDEAGADSVTFVAHPRFLKQLDASSAGAVLLAPDSPKPSTFAGAVIRVTSPQLAFAQILGRFEADIQHHPTGIHPTAVVAAGARLGSGVALGAHVVVEDDAVIGEGTVVYPLCYLGRGARVGRDCVIHPNVTIRERVQVGDRVILHPGVVLGSDGFGYVNTESGHHKIPQIGTVVVEDEVELGANVTVDRATTGVTRIGRGTKVDNLVQIAHNVQIGEETLLVSQVGIGGSTTLGRRVILAGQVGVIDHMTIGDGAVVTAQSGISRDVAAGEIVSGSPARPHREHQKMLALMYRIPELFDQVKRLVRVGAASSPPARREP